MTLELLPPPLPVLLLLTLHGGMLGGELVRFIICGDFSNTDAKLLLLGGCEEDWAASERGDATFGDSSLMRISGVDLSDGVLSWVDKFLNLSITFSAEEHDVADDDDI